MGHEYRFKKHQVWDCYKFAKAMIGNHNPDMIMARADWQIFRDDFRGKLGEVALRNYITSIMPSATIDVDVDYSVSARGKWDITDLVVNGKYINVKSVRGGSRFLLVEKNRYNDDGTYAYNNNDGNDVRVDLYVLVRVSIQPEFSKDDVNYDNVTELWDSKTIMYEVLGGITHNEFWNLGYMRGHIAPQYMAIGLENLDKIAHGVRTVRMIDVNDPNLHNPQMTLQQENFVISDDQLHPVKNLL